MLHVCMESSYRLVVDADFRPVTAPRSPTGRADTHPAMLQQQRRRRPVCWRHCRHRHRCGCSCLTPLLSGAAVVQYNSGMSTCFAFQVDASFAVLFMRLTSVSVSGSPLARRADCPIVSVTSFHTTTNFEISLPPPSAGIVAALAVLAAMGLWLCLRRRCPPGGLGDIEMPGPPGSTAPSYFPLLPNGLRSDNEVRALRGH